MPDVAKILREEITRLAKKEVKVAATKIKEENAALKQSVGELKKRVARLEKEAAIPSVKKASAPKAAAPQGDAPEELDKARVTAAMIKAIRKRLGLSQAKYADLIGVSHTSVVKWESKKGRLQFRGDTKAKIIATRAMKKTELEKPVAE